MRHSPWAPLRGTVIISKGKFFAEFLYFGASSLHPMEGRDSRTEETPRGG